MRALASGTSFLASASVSSLPQTRWSWSSSALESMEDGGRARNGASHQVIVSLPKSISDRKCCSNNKLMPRLEIVLACSAQLQPVARLVPTDVFSSTDDPALVCFLGLTRSLLCSTTAMASLFVQALFSYVILAMFWKLFREYLIHSPLDYIPGPPAPSGVTGQSINSAF